MPVGDHETLSRHRMRHIPQMRIDPALFKPVFHESCSMRNCNGRCCSEGVLLDPADKEKILAHTEIIQRYLEPGMERDPGKWFDGVVEPDMDFPSGFCEGTAAAGHGCVFLDSRGLCTLQKTAMGEGMHKFALKPFYCVAYPLTLERGTLTIEDADFVSRPACCSAVDNGHQSVLEVCHEELEFMLGAEGVEELQEKLRARE
jgi:hypothetical protein